MAELFKVNAPVRKPLFEGVQGENEARSIQFDITPWVEELGDGAVTATAKRSQDSQPYPVTVTKDGNTVTWKPTSTDTAFAGVGSFQLEYTVDDVLAKTCIWSTMVAPSLDPAGDPPDPYDNWLAEMRSIEASAIQSADDAEDSADAAAASAASVADLKSDFNEYVYSESDELVALSLQHDGYYNTSGVFVGESGRTYAIVNDVSVGEQYKVTTAIRSGVVPAILFFNGNTFLSYEKTGTGVDETLTDYQFTIPTNCDKLIVQNVDYGDITLKKVVKVPYYYTKTYINGILGKRIGKNLFDKSKSVDGYLTSTGGLASYLDWKTSDFIDVSDLDAVMLSVDNPSFGRHSLALSFLCTYGEGKTFIEQVGSTVQPPYTIPDNVQYIRFSYRDGTVDGVQLEAGSVITNYVPYKEYNIVIDSPYENGNSEYDGVTWAVFGDSLTEKNAKAVTSYYDYVSQALGCSIVNYGKSGTGYAKNSSGSDNFVARMLNINPNAFDVLTIFGSFNDISSGLDIGNPTDTGTETICGCINTTIDNFYSVAPYKPIGLVTPTPWKSVPVSDAWANQYADAIIAIGKRRGIPVLDLFRESGIRPWAGSEYIAEYYTENGSADIGAHPNSKGHKVFLYPHFREFLKTLV